MNTSFRTALLGLLLTVPALAFGATPINETRPLASTGTLSVSNTAGSIVVRGWDRNEVAITGELDGDSAKLEISGDSKALSVAVRAPGRSRGSVDEARLELRVPARAQLRLDAVSADISVAGTSGPISTKSVSGDVQLDVGSGEIEASTVSGDLIVKAPAFKTALNSVSGDLRASGLRGTLKAETVSGEMEVRGGSFREVSLQSVSGDVDLDLSLEDTATLSAETLSGDIVLRLPKAPNAQLSMKTFSGSLRNGFNAERAERGTRKVSATLGGGRGTIDLHTFSGDIRVDRR